MCYKLGYHFYHLCATLNFLICKIKIATLTTEDCYQNVLGQTVKMLLNVDCTQV